MIIRWDLWIGGGDVHLRLVGAVCGGSASAIEKNHLPPQRPRKVPGKISEFAFYAIY
jgi:hypothetical protein